jgi:hypothetical protein
MRTHHVTSGSKGPVLLTLWVVRLGRPVVDIMVVPCTTMLAALSVLSVWGRTVLRIDGSCIWRLQTNQAKSSQQVASIK